MRTMKVIKRTKVVKWPWFFLCLLFLFTLSFDFSLSNQCCYSANVCFITVLVLNAQTNLRSFCYWHPSVEVMEKMRQHKYKMKLTTTIYAATTRKNKLPHKVTCKHFGWTFVSHCGISVLPSRFNSTALKRAAWNFFAHTGRS